MSGRRRTGGAIGVIADVYQKSVNRRMAQEDKRRKFDQRLKELGIEAGIKSGAIAPTFEGGQFQGFQQQPSLPPMTMQGLESQLMGGQQAPSMPQGEQPRNDQGQFTTTITQKLDPQGRTAGFSVTRKQIEPKTATPRPMSEAEANRITAGATPGQPFPITPRPIISQLSSPTVSQPDRMREVITGQRGGMPSTGFETAQGPASQFTGGQQLLQSLIGEGQTESPAARFSIPSAPPEQSASPQTAQSPRPSWRQAIQSAAPALLGPAGNLMGLRNAFQQRRSTASPSRQLAGGPSLAPDDPSLADESGNTEGAQVKAKDGHIYEVRGGQWVRVQ